MKSFFLATAMAILSFGAFPVGVFSQTNTNQYSQQTLPEVFLLGEFNEQYEETMPGYQTLLEACNGDMESAFGKLTSMMKEMEAYANMTGYDLNGVNTWMHIFWRKDGSIKHIAFHLKPNSKNVDTKKLKTFLTDFVHNYKFPLNSEIQYSHYSSFSFPVVSKSMTPRPTETARQGN